MRTRVKICGITRIEDGLAAAAAGADTIGLVFYEKSPRHVVIDQAKEIVAALPPFVSVTGLFVDGDASAVEAVLQAVHLDVLQFHGHETPDYCSQFDRPYIKALRMKEGLDLAQCVADYQAAKALLLDTYKKGVPGGTGKSFNWSMVPKDLKKPIILAGGLKPVNIIDAINAVHPYAIDVSGGVESGPGLKDRDKIEALIGRVWQADGVRLSTWDSL